MTDARGRQARVPTWLDSLLFLAVMSGPPAIRDRDMFASLAGEIDTAVAIRLGVWVCAALWVAARLYPSVVKYGFVPAVNPPQAIGALLITALMLSLWDSPGFLLTAFTLGQFTITLTFVWLFADRFGYSSYLRHLLAGVCVLTLSLLAAAWLTPDLVIDAGDRWFRGDRLAPTGPIAGMGLIFCLSNFPRRLRSLFFWSAVGIDGVLLATSRMRTAYVGLLVYLAIGYLFGTGLRVRKLVPVLVALCISLIVLDAYAPATDYLVRDPTSVQDMSDRVPLWEYLTTTVLREQPVIGLGYYAASRVLGPQYNPRLGNAHSAFFEFLVGGGLLGAALYLALCASLLLYAARLLVAARGQAEVIASVGLLAFTLVLGLTSTEAVLAGPVGFTFWSMTAILPAMYRAVATRQAHAFVPAARRDRRPMVRKPASLLRS